MGLSHALFLLFCSLPFSHAMFINGHDFVMHHSVDKSLGSTVAGFKYSVVINVRQLVLIVSVTVEQVVL